MKNNEKASAQARSVQPKTHFEHLMDVNDAEVEARRQHAPEMDHIYGRHVDPNDECAMCVQTAKVEEFEAYKGLQGNVIYAAEVLCTAMAKIEQLKADLDLMTRAKELNRLMVVSAAEDQVKLEAAIELVLQLTDGREFLAGNELRNLERLLSQPAAEVRSE